MHKQISVAALSLSLLSGGPAMALVSSTTLAFRLSARVDPYCKISAPDSQIITLVNGAARIGIIHEICNTPGGYVVATSFTNLSGGQLNVDGQNYNIDASGNSLRQSPYPAIQDLNWQIADASEVALASPVVMRVTITPH